jgi:hypothetical protein
MLDPSADTPDCAGQRGRVGGGGVQGFGEVVESGRRGVGDQLMDLIREIEAERGVRG